MPDLTPSTGAATTGRTVPPVTDRATWQARIDELRSEEKAHTRAGDALAAKRRRLPMVEVDPTTTLTGADGPVPFIATFDSGTQLVVKYMMWFDGAPAAGQCEGCTKDIAHMGERSYLHSRDVTFAVFCQGPFSESDRYRAFMGWNMPWYSVPEPSRDALVADHEFGGIGCYLRDGDKVYETYWTTGRGNDPMNGSFLMLDLTVYGRQELWEDSPKGWPQHWGSQGGQFTLDDRPTAQWPRIWSGRDDDLVSRE